MVAQDTLYYDSECDYCVRRARKLQTRQTGGLQLVALQQARTDEQIPGGIPGQAALRRQLHLKTVSGTWLTGLDAAIVAWSHTPGSWWLAPLGWPLLKPLARVLYDYWELRRYRRLYSCKDCGEENG